MGKFTIKEIIRTRRGIFAKSFSVLVKDSGNQPVDSQEEQDYYVWLDKLEQQYGTEFADKSHAVILKFAEQKRSEGYLAGHSDGSIRGYAET